MLTCPTCSRASNEIWDAETRLLLFDGGVAHFSPNEGALFDLLYTNAGKLCRHDRLERRVWGLLDVDAENGLKGLIKKVRDKLPKGMTIVNVPGYDGTGSYWLKID